MSLLEALTPASVFTATGAVTALLFESSVFIFTLLQHVCIIYLSTTVHVGVPFVR